MRKKLRNCKELQSIAVTVTNPFSTKKTRKEVMAGDGKENEDRKQLVCNQPTCIAKVCKMN